MAHVNPELMQVFLEEAVDILQEWEKQALALEGKACADALSALFRAAHNLKGSARCVGLESIGAFVHTIEDLIVLLRDGALPVSKENIALVLEAHTTLSTWVNELNNNIDFEPDVTAQVERIVKVTGKTQVDKRQVRKDFGTILLEQGGTTADALNEAFRLQNRKIGEILVEEGLASENSVKDALKVQQKQVGGKLDETIRVSVSKLEALLQTIGELSIQQSIVWHARQTGTIQSESAQNAIYLANKITKEVQETALSLRMQSLQGLFQRLERAVHDIARELGKNVKISLEGGHVELDKTVIERVSDPLVHLLRNAVDHGIESTKERKEAGKALEGFVAIRAIQDASGVRIEVHDDGAGLDAKKIHAKAIEKKLVDPAKKLTETEVLDFIFAPGFSTAEKVTNISGRGVGMDVVRRAVDDIGGSLNIRTIRGRGTTFSVQMPTSVSILEALILSVGDIKYAVPIQDLVEIVDLAQYRAQTSTESSEMINLRGAVVPVIDLSALLRTDGLPSSGKKSAGGKHVPALVARYRDKSLALRIDRIEGQSSIVVRQLRGKLGGFSGFSGSTILGDGEPGMILNMAQLAAMYFEVFSTGSGKGS